MKTIFFAAGATVPFFGGELTTKKITDYVCEERNWTNIIDKYNETCIRNAGVMYHINNPYTFIREIKRPNDGKKINFEDLAEIIDKITTYHFANRTDNIFNLTLKTIINERCNNCFFNPQFQNAEHSWKNEPFLFRELIAELFLRSEPSEKYNKLKEDQKRFIEYVKSNSNGECSIISLNYDTCVQDSICGLDFELGLDENGEMNAKDFMSSKNVVYYPHGHLCFHITDENKVYYYKDAQRAEEERWKQLSSIEVGATETIHMNDTNSVYDYNTFITTGRNKDESLNRLPYSAYYQRLAIDFWNCDTIYIIGYSFGDEHFNRFIKNYIACEKGNVIVVDYCQTTNQGTTKIYNVKENKVYFEIGKIIETFVPNSRPSDAQKDLEETGVGNLSEKVKLYLKGYDAFLGEYDKVLDMNKD